MHGHIIIILGVQLESAVKKEKKEFVASQKAAVESGSGMVSLHTQRHMHTQWTDTLPLSLSYGTHFSLCVEHQERVRCRATNFITEGYHGVPGLYKLVLIRYEKFSNIRESMAYVQALGR